MRGRFSIFVSGLAFLISACAQMPSLPSMPPMGSSAPEEVVEEVATTTEPTQWQRATFGALADFAGKTFRGVPVQSSETNQPDIQHWHWTHGGAVLAITHALEDGSYGGVTSIYADPASGQLIFVYVTNAGFHTTGVMEVFANGTWTVEEAVEGHPEISSVKSTGIQQPDGSLLVLSEYLKGETWEQGDGFSYSATDMPVPALAAPVAAASE